MTDIRVTCSLFVRELGEVDVHKQKNGTIVLSLGSDTDLFFYRMEDVRKLAKALADYVNEGAESEEISQSEEALAKAAKAVMDMTFKALGGDK